MPDSESQAQDPPEGGGAAAGCSESVSGSLWVVAVLCPLSTPASSALAAGIAAASSEASGASGRAAAPVAGSLSGSGSGGGSLPVQQGQWRLTTCLSGVGLDATWFGRHWSGFASQQAKPLAQHLTSDKQALCRQDKRRHGCTDTNSCACCKPSSIHLTLTAQPLTCWHTSAPDARSAGTKHHLSKLPSQILMPGWLLGAAASWETPAAAVPAVSAVPVWLGGSAAASPEQDRSAGVSEDRRAGDGLADACMASVGIRV